MSSKVGNKSIKLNSLADKVKVVLFSAEILSLML